MTNTKTCEEEKEEENTIKNVNSCYLIIFLKFDFLKKLRFILISSILSYPIQFYLKNEAGEEEGAANDDDAEE